MSQGKKLFNLENLIKFRRNMHKNPELGFKEFKTQASIKEFLLDLGLQESDLKVCASTGYYVDIYGKAEKSGKPRLIALRTDIDALSMPEQNFDLEYRSTTDADHACGHDGHTATMLGFVSLYLENLDRIPSDKGVRILFQPSEEGPLSGAIQMIKEGCLEGVDEVYGYHNYPSFPVGNLIVTPGPMMASVAIVRINLYGKGGHGSTPEKCIDPVQMAVSFHNKFKHMNEVTFKDRNYVCTLPVLKGGDRYNVIAHESYMEGTMRSLEKNLPDEYNAELIKILEEVKAEFKGGDYKLDFVKTFDQVTNTEKETEIVLKLAKKYFGEDKAGDFNKSVPAYVAEDFSFYLNERPGCFYFLGSGREGQEVIGLHDSRFNFNDNLIKPGSEFFWKLVQDRLEIQTEQIDADQDFESLEGELKEFYDFHGVQLISWGFPASVTLVKKLYEKLKSKTFDAGKFFQIMDNQDEESFQVLANTDVAKHSDVFLIDHAVTFRYEQLRQALQADEMLLSRLMNITQYWNKPKKVPGLTPEPKQFEQIVEYDYMDIVDPNSQKINFNCQALSFYGNLIEDLEKVKQLLQKLPDLKVLWLNENPVAELENFRATIESEFPNIEILNSKFTKNVGAFGLKFVTLGQSNLDKIQILKPESIKYLDLSDRDLLSCGVDCATVLEQFQNLVNLNLKDHDLPDFETTNKFFAVLKSCKKLQDLQVDVDLEKVLLDLYKQEKLQDICPTLKYVNGHDLALQMPPLPHEDQIREVMSNIWKVAGCYRLASTDQYDESGIWYVNDEFGSSIQHSDDGNFKIAPFLFAPNNKMDQQTISYSIAWPLKDIKAEQELSRDYLMGITEQFHRSSKLVTWFDVPPTFFQEQIKKYDQQMAIQTVKGKQHIATTKLVQKSKEQVPKDRKFKTLTDSKLVKEFLKDEQFEFVSDLEEAEVIFCTSPIHSIFDKIKPDQLVNQFQEENCIIQKHNLKTTVEQSLGKVNWIQPTFDLNKELPIFIGEYMKRKNNHENNIWIVKTPNLARSMDMVVTDNLDVMIRLLETGPKIAQKYIERPLTLKNKKIDLRYIITLKSLEPLELFIYEVFWVRTSNNIYTNDYRTREIYDTHFTVMNYGKSLEQIFDYQFIEMFEKEYGSQISWKQMEKRIHNMIKEFFIGTQKFCPQMQDNRCRAVYGLDLMIDLNGFVPKMLEMNFSPDCVRACKFTPSFYNDVFGLLFLNKPETETKHIRLL